MVTVVTMLRGAAKRPSPSSRGAGPEVKGAYLRVEIAARQYNPNPLTFTPRRTLAGWEERPLAFPPCPTASEKV